MFTAKKLILDETREMLPVENKWRLEEGLFFVPGGSQQRQRQDERAGQTDIKDTGKMLGFHNESSVTVYE